MRIEKPSNGLYQAKLAQSQIQLVNSDLIASTGSLNNKITIVSNDLVTATGALDTKIDSNLSKLRIAHVNDLINPSFTTTTTTLTAITGSNTIYTKKYSDTELRVSVYLMISSGVSSYGLMAKIAYSVDTNVTPTWLSETQLSGSSYHASTQDMLSYLIHFNLGVLPAGTVNFRLGSARAGSASSFNACGFSYIFTEAMENA